MEGMMWILIEMWRVVLAAYEFFYAGFGDRKLSSLGGQSGKVGGQ
jgi:hypothetical protein